MTKIVSSYLYNLARKMNDIETVLSFNPLKILRRIRNKLVGRILMGKFINKLFKL